MKPLDPDALLAELDFERLAGTDGEARARDVILRELRAMGLEPKVEGFEVRLFEPDTATLEAGQDRFELVPHGLEGDREVEGELAFLKNADVLSFNRGAFRGGVVLAFSATGKTHEMVSKAGVASFIGIASPNRAVSPASHRQKWFVDGCSVPTMTVSYADGERLAARAGERARVSIRQTAGPRVAHNLVYLTAHYDSVARSHGAVDKAGGTVAALEVARYFAEHLPGIGHRAARGDRRVAQRRHALRGPRGALDQRGSHRRPGELPHPHARRRGGERHGRGTRAPDARHPGAAGAGAGGRDLPPSAGRSTKRYARRSRSTYGT